MRRVWIALLAISVTLVLALPVGAAPPKCDADPTLPGCGVADEDPPAGDPLVVNDTCYAHGEWGPLPVSGNFKLTLGGRNTGYPDGYCIDVLTGPGDWRVEIETTGKVQSLNLFLRDSVGAGDGCFTAPDGTSSCGYMFRTNSIPAEQVFAGMPGAWANACGDEWGEFVGSEWVVSDFSVGDWYADEYPSVESPLAFIPGIRAGSDATVELTVYLPEVTNEPVLIEMPQG